VKRPSRAALGAACLVTVLVFFVAAPADADESLGTLQGRIAAAHEREAGLGGEIDALTQRIRDLEAQAGDVSLRLSSLDRDLALHRRRLEKINALFELQNEQLRFLRSQYATAVARLNQRLVHLYTQGEPSPVEILLGARSLSDALDQLDYLESVAGQDDRIIDDVTAARVVLRGAHARTIEMRKGVAAATRIVAYRREQVAAIRNSLLLDQRRLTTALDGRVHALADTKASAKEWLEEANALRRPSVQVAEAIAAESAPASSSSASSSARLSWPVSGPITSPYGMRWGSLHAGIDITAGTGAPIAAAASGTVVVAGYSGGYGNLIVIDHGNGIATAYAHQSSLAASVGQQVSQGQTVGYVGSTGHSTGPHLHFEVRVNGSAVDPLGYL
jgi:murein DD-endopeptidase MepM/ murein hydrolase activator NlpD